MKRILALLSLLATFPLLAVELPTTIDTMIDLEGSTVTKTGVENAQFGNGGGIRNGTFDATYKSGNWWTLNGKTFTVGQNGVLLIKPSASENSSGQMNIKGGGALIIDGGAVTNSNYRGDSDTHQIGSDTATTGTLRIMNGGSFTSTKLAIRVGLFNGATGTISIDNGTFTVPNDKNIILAKVSGSTGVLAVTNGTINAKDIRLCESAAGGVTQLAFVNSTLNIDRIYKSNNPGGDSYCVFNGATINSGYSTPLQSLTTATYILEGNGLTINPSADCSLAGYYASRDNAPFIKTGSTTLQLGQGNFKNAKSVTGASPVSNFQVLGGTLNFTNGDNLPAANQLDLTVRNGAAVSGAINITDAVNSLTVDGTSVIPMTFDANGCNTIQATTLVLDTTSEHPVLLSCSGAFTPNVTYLVRDNITAADAAKIAVDQNSTLDVELLWRDNKLYAVPRLNGTILWNGQAGDNWCGTDKWLVEGNATTFMDYDSVVFNTADASTVLNQDAVVDELIVSNDVAISGTGNLTIDELRVSPGKVATISAPFTTTSMTLDGILDLGGETRNFTGSEVFRNGGGFRNGTFNVDITNGWWRMYGISFTVGTGAKLVTKKYSDTNGEANFGRGAELIIDGGEVVYNNNRGSSYGFYLGDNYNDTSSNATLRIQNGGKFTSTYSFLRIGNKENSTGILSVDGGEVELPNNKDLILGFDKGSSVSVVALTNCILTAETINLCQTTRSTVKMSMKDSTNTIQKLYKSNTPKDGSFVKFDGAVFNTAANSKDILSAIGIDYQLEGDGVTVNTTHTGTSVSGHFTGSAPFVKAGAKELNFSGTLASECSLSVQGGTFAYASGITVASAAFASGTTLSIPVTVENSVVSAPKLTVSAAVNVTGVNLTPTGVDNWSGVEVPVLTASEITGTPIVPQGLTAVVVDSANNTKTLVIRQPHPVTAVYSGQGTDPSDLTDPVNWSCKDSDDSVVSGLVPNEFTTSVEISVPADASYSLSGVGASCSFDKQGAGELVIHATAQDQEAGHALTLTAGKVRIVNDSGSDLSNYFAATTTGLAGVLDLGGTTQTFSDDPDNVFSDGAEIINGTLNLTSNAEWKFGTVTFGANLNMTCAAQLNDYARGGEKALNFTNGCVCAFTNVGDHYLGRFISSVHQYSALNITTGSQVSFAGDLYIGSGTRGHGTVVVDNATLTTGNKKIYMIYRINGDNNGFGTLTALNGAVVECANITISKSGYQKGECSIAIVDSTLKLGQIYFENTGSENTASCTFSNAVVEVTSANANGLFRSISPVVAEGGTLAIRKKNALDGTVTVGSKVNGPGAVTLANGLALATGAQFGGAVTVEEGVAFYGVDTSAAINPAVALLTADGVITAPKTAQGVGKNYYSVKDGTLYIGARRRGLAIVIRTAEAQD